MVESTPSDQQPGADTPARRARSVRRTTTHDCTRPAGLDGPVVVRARGRDLATDGATDDGGTERVVGWADLAVEIGRGGSIQRISAEPVVAALEALVGTSAASGFRRAADEAVASTPGAPAVLLQLLDDLPTAFMLSGRVLRTNGIGLGRGGDRLPIDICAGWVADGTLVAGYTDLGPPLHRGPEARATERADDADAWHDHQPLPAHATRRRRRLDVWIDDGGGHAAGFFRDTHADDDGVETVVHHYAVEATIDLASMTIRSCAATPGPLPYGECPGAATSASRLVGTSLDGLRRAARRTLVGPTTCTHLTDALGCLEGAGPLLHTLVGAASDRVVTASARPQTVGEDGDDPEGPRDGRTRRADRP